MIVSHVLDDTVGQLFDALRSGQGGMASGAAVAASLAMAALLTGMAARRAEDWPEAAGAAAQAETLCARAVELVDEDARALLAARAALDGRSDLPADSRDITLSDVLFEAAEAPARIAELAADVALLAREVSVRGHPDSRADAAAAALLAAGAARGAAHLVEVNLGTSKDDPLAAAAAGAATRADETARAAQSAGV